jgi:gamma-glutamyl-gamma-aminobutyrate hydrolase PuuD
LIESAGGRALAINYGDDDESWNDEVIEDMNGLLLSSGSDNEAHKQWTYTVIERVLARNDLGNYVPIMGISLGMQRLAYYFNDKSEDIRV